MREGLVSKRVAELRPGDVVAGTLQRIVSVDQPLRGESQCRVVAVDISKHRKDATRTHYWGARTTVAVVEDPTAEPWLSMTSTVELERRVAEFCESSTAVSSASRRIGAHDAAGGAAAGSESTRAPRAAPAQTFGESDQYENGRWSERRASAGDPSSNGGSYPPSPTSVRDQLALLDAWDGTDDHADPQASIYEPQPWEDLG